MQVYFSGKNPTAAGKECSRWKRGVIPKHIRSVCVGLEENLYLEISLCCKELKMILTIRFGTIFFYADTYPRIYDLIERNKRERKN